MIITTKNGNINHSTTPHYAAPHPDLPGGISPQPPLQYSAIYGGRETRWRIGNFPPGGSGTPKKQTHPPLLLHKTEIVVHLDKLDLELIERFAKDNYNQLAATENTGEIYYVKVYKETEGESLTIFRYHNSGKYKIQFVTHKTQRLLEFKKLLEHMGVNTVYKFYFEAYVRYHEYYERNVELTQEATLRQYGKRQKIENHMIRGKKIAYMNQVLDVQYRGLMCKVKTYRHGEYNKYSEKNPEYHPKLEVACYAENTQLKTISIETIRIGALLLNTVIKATWLRPIYGEYEKNQEQITINTVDYEILRVLRGVKKRVKAIQILDREYHDIRLAIAKLLVEKQLKIVEIAKLLGYSDRWIKKIIQELLEQDIIVRTGKGKYTWAKQKIQLEKQEIIRHHYMRSINELIELIETIRKEHKLIRVNTKGTIYIDYETEYERVRLITNVIANNRDVEIIDPITRRRTTIPMSPHKLQIL